MVLLDYRIVLAGVIRRSPRGLGASDFVKFPEELPVEGFGTQFACSIVIL
jgi:hypothetical protein